MPLWNLVQYGKREGGRESIRVSGSVREEGGREGGRESIRVSGSVREEGGREGINKSEWLGIPPRYKE